ncbi:MAG TPA: ERAP1-like C-terminal domain-containing protein, partial [Geobacterales bacterium]|nr:ERAP1-like C-terminal domain-containing protein [Geobacterales bacterium]
RFSFFEKSDDIWPIPLTLEINGKREDMVLEEREKILEFNEEIKSLKVNLNRAGFYRVFYEDLEPVFKANLSKEEKFGIVNDCYQFLLAGLISPEQYEALVKKFMNVDDNLVSLELSDDLFTLFLINPNRFKKLAIEFHLIQKEIWKKRNDELSKSVYGRICERLVILSDEFARELAKEYENYNKLDPNLKQAVLTAYSRTNGEKAFNELLEKYRKEIFDEERERLLIALVYSKEPYLALMASSLVFTGEVKRQDVRTILFYLSRNPEIKTLAWTWVRTNFKALANIYAGTGIFGRSLAQIIPLLGLGRESEVEQFLTAQEIPEISTGIKDGLEMLKVFSRLAK